MLSFFSSMNVHFDEGAIPLEISDPLEDKTDENTKTPHFYYTKLLAKLLLFGLTMLGVV